MRLARGLILAGSLLVSGEARGADGPIPLRSGVSPQDRRVYIEVESVTPEQITFVEDTPRRSSDGGVGGGTSI